MKETLLAIILGSLLGFGLTGTYFALNKNTSPKITPPALPTPSEVSTDQPSIYPNITSNPNPNETEDTTSNIKIIIESPEHESIVNNSQISIKGSTNPQATIIITTATKSYFTFADKIGNFAQTVEVESGANQIQIDAIDKATESQTTTKITVTYSTAKI